MKRAEINERQARRQDEFLKVSDDSLAILLWACLPYHWKGGKTQWLRVQTAWVWTFCVYHLLAIYLEVKVKVTQLYPTLGYVWPHGLYSPWNSPGQNTGLGGLSLLQGIFSTQESNPGLPHCWQILYQLSHQGSPRILEWVAYPFSSETSWPRNWTRVSCIAGGFFTNWVKHFVKKNSKFFSVKLRWYST